MQRKDAIEMDMVGLDTGTGSSASTCLCSLLMSF